MSKTRFVSHFPFQEYQARLAEHFEMQRNDGVIEVRFHTEGGEAHWSLELHRAMSQMFQAVGQDPENEVLILSGTGEAWLQKRDIESIATMPVPDYERAYRDSTKLVESLLWSVDIPTISAINGPGFHTEFGLLCDLTIAADDARFFEPHFSLGVAPGDGQFLVYQELLGLKRANHAMYLRDDGLSAAEALQLGLVGEVLPRDQLLPRARAMAAQIMRQPKVVRRLTTQIAKRPWRRAFQADFGMHLTHELFGWHVTPRPISNYDRKA